MPLPYHTREHTEEQGDARLQEMHLFISLYNLLNNRSACMHFFVFYTPCSNVSAGRSTLSYMQWGESKRNSPVVQKIFEGHQH
jgi:hypothetical protein